MRSFSVSALETGRSVTLVWTSKMAKLYVGNLPFSLDEQGVREIFEQYGPVRDVVLIKDRETGRPRGFGFVEMSDEDCDTAVGKLNGQRVEGRVLKVDVARERDPRPPRGRPARP